ncbi:MAG TPA: hypothetical protein VFI39_10100 [Gemmatimonadales bacterium]|nr:hypothetical protein [Gemmatimonadales bacterium]
MDNFPAQPGFYFPTWPFEHIRMLATGQIILALCAVWTGIAFLKLRPWSRPVLEIFAWLTLAAVFIFSAVWVRTALSMSTAMGSQTQVAFPGGLFVAMGMIPMLIFVALNVLVIRTLRGRVVRTALGNTVTDQADSR